MHAVVVGCGRVGSAVASRLAGEGWTVAVIDQLMESFNRLDPARAELYARLGLRTVCPTTTAIDTLSAAVLSSSVEV